MEADRAEELAEAADHRGVPGSGSIDGGGAVTPLSGSSPWGGLARRMTVDTISGWRSGRPSGTRTDRTATRPIPSHATIDAERRWNSPIRTGSIPIRPPTV